MGSLLFRAGHTRIRQPPVSLQKFSDAEEVFIQAKKGDEIAENVLEKVYEFNAKALGTVANILGPESIVIGGAVALENEEVIDNIK